MVLGKIRDIIQGKPTLDGPSRLPEYFPVQPIGSEKHSENLFQCLATKATAKARDMEKAGLHSTHFPNVSPRAVDENAAKKVQQIASGGLENDGNELPKAGDNPLDECRDLIAYYKRCSDRELKRKKNWNLIEPFRVQEEYRYNNNGQ